MRRMHYMSFVSMFRSNLYEELCVGHAPRKCAVCGKWFLTTDARKNKKIATAVYLYQADNDGEWGEIRFDFENGTVEIVKLADWDTMKSNIFAKTAIRYIQGFPEAGLLKSVAVPFWKGRA